MIGNFTSSSTSVFPYTKSTLNKVYAGFTDTKWFLLMSAVCLTYISAVPEYSMVLLMFFFVKLSGTVPDRGAAVSNVLSTDKLLCVLYKTFFEYPGYS